LRQGQWLAERSGVERRVSLLSLERPEGNQRGSADFGGQNTVQLDHPVLQSAGHLLGFGLAVLKVKPLRLLQIGSGLPGGGLLSLGLFALSAILSLPGGAKFLVPEVLLPRAFPLDLRP
jgi:hypothetical protein